MRLRRLDLTRFGHFTDYSIDFGKKKEGKSDLHIIFGPNEAGKTTAFDGYLDLIFGVPSRSKYNFLHDYENMRVGGVLEIDGDPVDLIRIKRNKGDLITPSGETANPARLLRALDSIDRDQYRAMFSLDDETIEAGGEDILASQGNLGELLFSAAAGLSDLGAVLEKARADVDQFHKPRARKTELAEAKRELQDLHNQIRDLDVPASAFRSLKEERDAAAKLLAEAKETRDALLGRQARLEAMIDCLPLLKTLGERNEAISAYVGYPSVSDGALAEAQELKSRHVEAATKLRQSKLTLETEETARKAIDLDTGIAGSADELTVLLDAPRSRAQTAEEDLPKRETEIENLTVELNGFAKELGIESPDEGAIPEARLAQLEEISANYAGTKTQLASARREEAEALKKLEMLKNDGEDEIDSASELGLDELLEDLEPEARLARIGKTTEDEDATESNLKQALQNLRPWAGDPSEVAKLSFSEAEAVRIVEHWTDLRAQKETATRELEEAQRDYNRVAARLEEFEKGNAASVDEEAKEIRGERDTLWEDHSKDLTRETAQKFHASMMRDDALQEARLGFAERLARLRELQLESASSKANLSSRKESLSSAEANLEKEAASLRKLLAALGLPETYDPRDLKNWQVCLLTAQKLNSELKDKKKRSEEAMRSADEAVGRLKNVLSVSDETLDLRELTKRARAVLAEAASVRAKAEAHKSRLDEVKAEVTRRSNEVRRIFDATADFEANWENEVATLPKSLRGLDDFRWKLQTLRKLAGKLVECDQLQRRVQAMKDDRLAFEQKIVELAEHVGEPADVAPLVLGERLRRRLERANKFESDLQKLIEAIAKARAEVRAAESDLADISIRIEEMALAFEGAHEVHSIDDLIEALDRALAADQLRKQSKELSDRILKRLGVSELVEAEDMLAGQDVLELEGNKAAVTADLKTAEANNEEKVGDLRAARDALERVGGDNAPAQLEEKRQTLLLDLEERARGALRLRLGILAAEQALTAYRDDHRSNMLAETQTAFRKLTGGKYQDLRTQADGQREVLLALRKRDSRSITVAEMSKGTRFQLYLALRLSGYRQYVSSGTTLPFVADDIMETFDNMRTAAALSLLREVSEQGQALYFTHHEHVVELAKEVCGDQLSIHRLPQL